MGRVSKVVAVLAAVGMLFSGGGMASAAESSGAAPDGVWQCVPDRSTIAQCFPDKLLAQAIAYKLKGGPGWTGEVLTSKDVDDTTYLYLYHYSDSSGISSVQGLQVFTNLTSLYLNGTLVSDVSPLSKLTNLTDLDLWYTGVSDVSPLSKLTNLNYLDLSSTQVSDVSPLSKLVKLKTLDLDGTRVRDLSPLSKLPLDWINSQYPSSAQYVRPSVKLTVNADGSVSLPAPRWTDGSFVAPSSTSPAGGVLDAKRGAVTWKGYDAKASYSYDFDRGGVFTGHVTGVKPAPTPKVYAVSFDSQGGSGVVSQRVTAGRRASRPADPARSGFTFAGWYTAKSGGSKYDFSKPVTRNLTLYARWAKKAQPAASTVTMFRLYNPNSGEHFYTGNAVEKNHLAAIGWKYEGIGWTAPAKSGTPVYRLYNPYAGDHHYTLNKAERDNLVRLGWRYEGIGWYSAENSGRRPLYREYNPNARAGAHNYTLNKAENDHLVRVGWRYEGVAWYAVHA